jgi:hypothetical protein
MGIMKSDYNKERSKHNGCIKISSKIFLARCLMAGLFFLTIVVFAGSLGYADEEDQRRVDISLSIFPRIVAVDNDFREKLVDKNKVQLLFLYAENKKRAENLAEKMEEENKNIGGMGVMVSALSISSATKEKEEKKPTAIFISERLSDDDLKKVIAFAEAENRIVFSPFSGDVERGAMVGISVTNRVKPYFNLTALRRSKVDINALLIKMSKIYE